MLNTSIRKIFTVNSAVTRLTEGQTICNVKSIIRKVCPLFNVVGVQVLFITAMLTSVFITGEYCFTPSGDIGLLQLSFCLAFTALPSRMTFAPQMQSVATGHAARLTRLATPRGERSITCYAVLRDARIAAAPTLFRTKLRLIGTKWLYVVRRMADGANLLHNSIISHSKRISENYCAVILERMATAFPDIEIKRIDQATAAKT